MLLTSRGSRVCFIDKRYLLVVPKTAGYNNMGLSCTDYSAGKRACRVKYAVIEVMLGWSNSNVVGSSTPNSSVNYYTSSEAARESIPASIRGTSTRTLLPTDSVTIDLTVVLTCPGQSNVPIVCWINYF